MSARMLRFIGWLISSVLLICSAYATVATATCGGGEEKYEAIETTPGKGFIGDPGIQTITIKNIGTETVKLSVGLTGSKAFILLDLNSCNGKKIGAGSSCAVKVDCENLVNQFLEEATLTASNSEGFASDSSKIVCEKV